MTTTSRRYGRAHAARRAWWATRLATTGPVPCTRCRNLVTADDDWHLDHYDDDNPTASAPAHAACNTIAGTKHGAELRAIGAQVVAQNREQNNAAVALPSHSRRNFERDFFSQDDGSLTPRISETPLQDPETDPIGLAPTDRAWDSSRWLDSFREIPDGASWPRFMTAPHPAAVGSYGAEFIQWAERRGGRNLRWWQRLASTRMLEHDESGWLVWLWVLLTTARQVGKSTGFGLLSLWRTEQAERFGEQQLVLLTSKDLPAARELHAWGRSWARAHRGEGFRVREANGQEEVIAPDGSRWAVRGSGSVYSYAANVAAVDECWAVEPAVVDDGIEPTTVEKASPQVQLASTAHRKTTPLFPLRRRQALAELGEPAQTLLLEWSAPRSGDIGDPAMWRLASPYWSPQRQRLLAAKYAAAIIGASDDPLEADAVESFRSQWLNQWPVLAASRAKDEPLLGEGAWAALGELSAPVPDGPLTLAVEDYFGLGSAAAAASLGADGRVFCWGRLFASRADAFGWSAQLAAGHGGSRLLVGASLDGDEAARDLPVVSTEPAGQAQTRVALPLLRQLVTDGRLCHDDGGELTGQVRACRVAKSADGLVVTSRSGRSDLLRAVAWAVEGAVRAPAPLPFFVH